MTAVNAAGEIGSAALVVFMVAALLFPERF